MNAIARNVTCFAVIAGTWIFFFVPNPAFNMLNVQGLEYRLGWAALFVLVPGSLAIVSMLFAVGSTPVRIALTLLVPVFGAVLCYLLWFVGVYSSTEDLLGGLLYGLTPLVPYMLGTLVAMVPLRRRPADS